VRRNDEWLAAKVLLVSSDKILVKFAPRGNGMIAGAGVGAGAGVTPFRGAGDGSNQEILGGGLAGGGRSTYPPLPDQWIERGSEHLRAGGGEGGGGEGQQQGWGLGGSRIVPGADQYEQVILSYE